MKKTFLFMLICGIIFLTGCNKDNIIVPDIIGDYTIVSIDSCTQIQPYGEFSYKKHYENIGGTISFFSDSSGFLAVDSLFLCFGGDFKWKHLGDDYIVCNFNGNDLNAQFDPHEKGTKLNWLAFNIHCGETIRSRRLYLFDLKFQE